jgi:glutathione S-transferase
MTDRAFTLYGSPHSQFTYKVALMLRLCARPFRFRYVSFREGMHRTPEFLALSPFGQVPVLRHDGLVLCQSGVILRYLSETLRRFGASASRQIDEYLFWDADRLAPSVYRSHGFELGRRGLLPNPVDPMLVAHYRTLAEGAFGVLDARLEGRDFLVGEDATIADIACYGDVAFAPHAGLDLSPWANIASWSARLAELPGFRAPFDLLSMADANIA